MNVTMSGQARDKPRVQEMVIVHRILRREFEILSQLVPDVPSGHAERAEAIAMHIDFTLAALHNHHSTEDEYLWPMLLDRARPSTDLIHRMETQHRVVAECIEQVERLVSDWRQEPTPTLTAQLAESLAGLTGALFEHLDDEETQILPLVTKHVTAAEWEAFGQRAFDKFPRSALPIMLGQMLEHSTPQESAMFFGKLPALVRLIWRLSSKRQYERYVARVRATSGPGPKRKGLYRVRNRLTAALHRSSGRRIGGSTDGLHIPGASEPRHKSRLKQRKVAVPQE